VKAVLVGLLTYALAACGGGGGSTTSPDSLVAFTSPSSTNFPTPSGAMHSPNPNPVGPQPTTAPSAAAITAPAATLATPTPVARATGGPTPAPAPSPTPTLQPEMISSVVCPSTPTPYLFVNGVATQVTLPAFEAFYLSCTATSMTITLVGNTAFSNASDAKPNPLTTATNQWIVAALTSGQQPQTLTNTVAPPFGTAMTVCDYTYPVVQAQTTGYCDHIAQARFGFPAAGDVQFAYTIGPVFLEPPPWP
jgi:hypothetical protein